MSAFFGVVVLAAMFVLLVTLLERNHRRTAPLSRIPFGLDEDLRFMGNRGCRL